MVDINIKSGQGISYALADYAKQLNGGKALKLNTKQWQSIMNTVDEINRNRTNKKIYSGDKNIFGSGSSNFVVQEGTISFSDEEMTEILKQMGLNQEIIDREFPSTMNVKGLSVERTAPQVVETESKQKDVPLETQAEPETATKLLTPQSSNNQEKRLTFIIPPQYSAQVQSTGIQPQENVDNALPQPIEPQTTNFFASVSTKKIDIEETIENPEQESSPKTEKSGNNNRTTLLNEADNVKFYSDGSVKSLDLNIKDLNWTDNNNRKTWNENNQLVSEDLDNLKVKNSSGEVIANYHGGKYFIGEKEVDYNKFQKFAAKNGQTLTLNYKPDIKNLHPEPVKLSNSLNLKMENSEPLNVNLQQNVEQTQQEPVKQYTKKTLTREFYNRVEEIAKKINCTTEDLLAIMNSESGLDSSKQNRWTNATGLIQFMPKTAEALGTSVEELAQMSPLQQLNYVEKYLVNAKKAYIKDDKPLSAGDLYGLIFMPAKSGQENLAVRGTRAYRQNKSLDYNGDGIISRADLEAHVNKKQVDVTIKNA